MYSPNSPRSYIFIITTLLPEIILNGCPVGPISLVAYSANDAVVGNPTLGTESVKLELIAWEPVNGIPNGKWEMLIVSYS